MRDANILVARASLSPDQAALVLGAMRDVASTGGSLSDASRRALTGAAAHVLHTDPAVACEAPILAADALADGLGALELRRYAAQLIAVMALVDGTIDAAKLERAIGYASALGVSDDYVRDLSETALGHIELIVADMSRRNAESIRGLDVNADFARQFVPYNERPDPDLAARFRALERLSHETFGRAFYDQYAQNGYAFPGEYGSLSIIFGVPHDSAHILAGYGTSAQGELLVSTSTAAMHRIEGMAGHILPVIYSWHLGIEFNPLASSATGAFDGDKFWRAWERGAATKLDTFGADFDFWSLVEQPIADVRGKMAIPPLDAEHAADGLPPPVRPWPA